MRVEEKIERSIERLRALPATPKREARIAFAEELLSIVRELLAGRSVRMNRGILTERQKAVLDMYPELLEEIPWL
ncbi:MAG: hypothetical protein JRD89_04525 [Deltaproteobacteria bacterium]|nr:hypothetical protein [Deltaproteobacteria bacterium]